MTRRTAPRPVRRPVRRLARRVAQSLLVVLALVAVPDSAVHPASFSLVALADAKAVDFDDGIVWFLVLGSDAREGEDVMDGRADAIELVGLDFDTGRATAVAVPRDTWVDIPGHGSNRINAALHVGGPELVADLVEELVGIAPNYVFTTGFDGFVSMVDSIGPVPVVSARLPAARRSRPRAPGCQPNGRRGGARVRPGPGGVAAQRLRPHRQPAVADEGHPAGAAGRRGHRGVHRAGEPGRAAGFETDLSPVDLYRLAQAVTTFRVSQVTTCAIIGTPAEENGAQVLHVDPELARRVGKDVRNDARLDRGVRLTADRDGRRSLQAGLPGQHDRLGPVRDLELREDVARVVAHRLGGDAELARDLGVLQARRRCARAPSVRDR